MGPFLSMVIESRQRYFALSYPQGPKLPEGFSWKGQQVGMHFWRSEDAGYFLKTRVLDDFLNQKYPIIHAAHTDDVVRTQQRKSLRVKMDQSASVYPLKSIQDADEVEVRSPGLRCRLKDISEDGAAIMVGGRTKAGLPLKIQFDLAEKRVVMCGVVRGVSYDSAKNVSLLHLQAANPSLHTRNHLLTYVYNLFGEQEKVKT
jgi:c-di-GMP-binding flagellar brake protein YcgR